MITISAFRWVPPFAQGLVRDLRVRWALEEAGLPYQVRLVGQAEKATQSYRDLQPFSQVPSFEEDGLVLFESGAIVLHIAGKSTALSPRDEAGRARMTTWVLAALNTLEPPVQNLASIDFFHPDETWAKLRRPGAVEAIESRLKVLAERLAEREWLEDRFTAGDLMMTTVLRILRHTDLVQGHHPLADYVARCEARPAFERALAAQMEPFSENTPG